MALRVIFGDITKSTADAVVIPANPKPIVGNGLDKILYKMAGRKRLLEARKEIGEMDFGEAAITPAFDFKAKYFVHAVSPAWDGGDKGEIRLLEACYKNSLTIAYEKGCRSIVFPLLSTGVLNYPKKQALEIAEHECRFFLQKHEDMDITILQYNGVVGNMDEIIRDTERILEENYYGDLKEADYHYAEDQYRNLPKDHESRILLELLRKKYNKKQEDIKQEAEFYLRKYGIDETIQKYNRIYSGKPDDMVREIIETLKEDNSAYENELTKIKSEKSFRDLLMEHLIKSGETDAEIARRCNLSPPTLSRFKSGERRPNRENLWALAIGLELDINETEELFESCDTTIGSRRTLEDAVIKSEMVYEDIIRNRETYNKDKEKYGVKYLVELCNCKLVLGNLITIGNRDDFNESSIRGKYGLY